MTTDEAFCLIAWHNNTFSVARKFKKNPIFRYKIILCIVADYDGSIIFDHLTAIDILPGSYRFRRLAVLLRLVLETW